MDKTHFALDAGLVSPETVLSFFKGAHDLKSLESGIRCFHGFKAQSGFDESFEFSMV